MEVFSISNDKMEDMSIYFRIEIEIPSIQCSNVNALDFTAIVQWRLHVGLIVRLGVKSP